ncbi:hypothetical protein BLNAU_2591 [Blattamonas nauphoetae]|uniref:DUF4378 domain-containing protein n=1 Tax=Blattamonas nauphoetae TaxID=2049346 RepID=A0ABQ9YF78_9EUKA|nr:hypothetical protein BLNAU_2591 [Blattamonas nauphoetae]
MPSPPFKTLHVGRENITLLVSCPSGELVVSADHSIVLSSDLLSYLCVLFEQRMIGTMISLTTPQKQDRNLSSAHPINRTSLASSGSTVSVMSRREVVVSPHTPARQTQDNRHRMSAEMHHLEDEEARTQEQLKRVQAELEALSNRTYPQSTPSRSHPRRHATQTYSSHTSLSSLSSNDERPSHTQRDHVYDHHQEHTPPHPYQPTSHPHTSGSAHDPLSHTHPPSSKHEMSPAYPHSQSDRQNRSGVHQLSPQSTPKNETDRTSLTTPLTSPDVTGIVSTEKARRQKEVMKLLRKVVKRKVEESIDDRHDSDQDETDSEEKRKKERREKRTRQEKAKKQKQPKESHSKPKKAPTPEPSEDSDHSGEEEQSSESQKSEPETPLRTSDEMTVPTPIRLQSATGQSPTSSVRDSESDEEKDESESDLGEQDENENTKKDSPTKPHHHRTEEEESTDRRNDEMKSIHEDNIYVQSQESSSEQESSVDDDEVKSDHPPEPEQTDDHSKSVQSPTSPHSTPVTPQDPTPQTTSDGDKLDTETFSASSASSRSRPDRDLHPLRWIQEQLKREEHSKTQKQDGRTRLISPLQFNTASNNLSAKLGLSPRNTQFAFDMRAHPATFTPSNSHTPSTPPRHGDHTANVSILDTPKFSPQSEKHGSPFNVTPFTPKSFTPSTRKLSPSMRSDADSETSSFWQNLHETESKRREKKLYDLFSEWEKKMRMCRNEIGMMKREYGAEKKKLAALAQMDADWKERTSGFKSKMEEEEEEARKHEMTEIVRKMVELKDRAKDAKRNLSADLQRIESDVRRECSESNRRLQQLESQRMFMEKLEHEPKEDNRMTNEELVDVLEKRKEEDEKVAGVSMPVTPRSHSTLKAKREEIAVEETHTPPGDEEEEAEEEPNLRSSTRYSTHEEDEEEEEKVNEQKSTPVRPAPIVTEPVVLTPQQVDHLLTSAVSNEQTVLLLSPSQTVHSVLHTLSKQHLDLSPPRERDEEPDADIVPSPSHSPAILEKNDLSDMSDLNSSFPTLEALTTPFDLPVLTESISPREQERNTVENVKKRKDKAKLEEYIKQHNEEEQKKRMGAQDDSAVSPHKADVAAPSSKDEVFLGTLLGLPTSPASPLRIRRSEKVQVDCRYLLKQYLSSAHFVSLFLDAVFRFVEQEDQSLPLYGVDEQVDWSYSDLEIFKKASKSPPPTIQNPKQRHFFLPVPEEIDVTVFDTVNPEVQNVVKAMVDKTVRSNTKANLLLPSKDKQTPHFEILPNSVPSSEEIRTIVNKVTFPLFDTLNEKLGSDRRELVKESQLSEAVTMSLWRKDVSGQLSQDELSSPFMKLHVPSQSSQMKHAPLFILRVAQLTFHYLVFQACLPLNYNTITSIVNRPPSSLSGDEYLLKDQQSYLLKQAPVRLDTSILSYALLLPPLSPSAQWTLTQMEEDEPQLKLRDEEKLDWISAGQERETMEVAQEQNVDLLVSYAVLKEEHNDWDLQVMSDFIVEMFVEEIATGMIDEVLDEVGMERGEPDPEYEEEERE